MVSWLRNEETQPDQQGQRVAQSTPKPVQGLGGSSEGGGKAAAIADTLIETAKLNGVDPQTWLPDVLARIADQKTTRLDELTPWSYAAKAA
ncbi:MAG: transposase domain-containing protein [Pseudomonadota bacterium]